MSDRRMPRVLLLLLTTSLSHSESSRSWSMAEERASVPKHVDVFTGGVDGYFAYRIPSLIVAPNGNLLVFCEARKDNLSDDGNIDLVMKRSTDGGAVWLPQQLIYEEGGDARINTATQPQSSMWRPELSGWPPTVTTSPNAGREPAEV